MPASKKFLPYASQQETLLDRANREEFKLRKKLKDDGGIGNPVWKKCKGMHRSNFERLIAKVEEQDEIANAVFIVKASSPSAGHYDWIKLALPM